MQKTFALIGGDRRQAYLADLFARDGHCVHTYGLGSWSQSRETALEQALQADLILLPLPLCRAAGTLNCEAGPIRLEELFAQIPKDRLVLAGQVGPEQQRAADTAGIQLTDYFAREELTVANAVPSAEGAIQVAMERLPMTICGLKCLVIGYGRIGKLLAHHLSALGAEVSVSARSCPDRAWIKAFGWKALDTGALRGHLGAFQAVFNTVPAPVLPKALLAELPDDCLCIELASVPGIDLEAAEARGLQAVWARGLPGKLSPYSAAAAIRDTVYHILEERGESV